MQVFLQALQATLNALQTFADETVIVYELCLKNGYRRPKKDVGGRLKNIRRQISLKADAHLR